MSNHLPDVDITHWEPPVCTRLPEALKLSIAHCTAAIPTTRHQQLQSTGWTNQHIQITNRCHPTIYYEQIEDNLYHLVCNKPEAWAWQIG